MPFENLQPERKEIDRRLLVFFTTLLLFLPAFLIFNYLAPRLGFENRNPQLYHAFSLFDEEQMNRVRELCQNLPKPEKFDFVSSFEDGGVESSTIIYRFDSTREAEEIMPMFLIWFNENGWRQVSDTSTLKFEKGNQKIYISVNSEDFHGFPNQYEIYCSEKK